MSRFPGQNNHMPGAYRMAVRSSGFVSAAYGEFDIRSTLAWLSAAGDILTSEELTALQARGEIKQVSIFIESGTLEYADAEVPGGGYRVDATTGPSSISINYSNRMGRSTYWLRTVGGAVDYQIEVYFDIPPQEYV